MAHERRMGAKGALTEHPPGAARAHWAPAGRRIPRALWSTDLFNDVMETKWVLGPLLVHVLG